MPLERGIRQTRSGWQVFVRVHGEFRSKHFKPDTPLETLRRWRDEQDARRDADELLAGEDPTLAQDCETYLKLPSVTRLTVYKDRAYRVRRWPTFFPKHTLRKDLTAVTIGRALDTLLETGLAPATVNLYRTDLIHLYRKLDGKSAVNPALDVDALPMRRPPLKLPTWKEAERVIKAIASPQTRARLSVLLWTGWPSAQVKRLTPGDIHFRSKTVKLLGRKKGKGTPDVTLPVLPGALTALRAFHRAKAYGPFSGSSLRKALHRACKAKKVTPFRVYDLRHLFLTTAAIAIKDDRVVAALGLHRDTKMTERYTEQSVNPRVRQGLDLFAKSFRAR